MVVPEPSSGQSVDSMAMTPKRKRYMLTPTPTTEATTILDKPLGQLSISQGEPKRQRATTPIAATAPTERDNESPPNAMENFKPRYLTVSDHVFRQLLSNAIGNGDHVVQCLDTTEKLHFVRHMTELTNNLYFTNLQRQLWQAYHNTSSKDDDWESTITKQYAHQHHTCRMHRPRKSQIIERRMAIELQMNRLGEELGQHLTQLKVNVAQWQPTIDCQALSHTINECVKNNQQRLSDEFNHRKAMIDLDWKDHSSIKTFYALKPDEQVILVAKKIWQTTDDELKMKDQLEILRQRIYLKRLPPKTDHMVDQLLDDQSASLSNPFLDKDQRASFVTRCSKAVIRCKFNLMVIQIDEFEAGIRGHQAKLIILQKELAELKKKKPNVNMDALIKAIEERRQAMMDRLFRLRQQKLKTFFDEAPTMDNN